MRERGRYQLQLVKTRNSGGVGQKIDLGFDLDTLRITDCDDDDESYSSAPSGATSIVNALKRNNTPSEKPEEGVPAGKIHAETDSTKLRAFINNLGDDD
jgi:hypothetical protein